MKKLLLFMLLLTVLLLTVSCGGDASESTGTGDSTGKVVSTTPDTTAKDDTPPEEGEDELFRAGFTSYPGLYVVGTHHAYEIPKEVFVLEDKVPITLYFAIDHLPSVEGVEFPEDAEFVLTLRRENNEEVFSFGRITYADLQSGDYGCTVNSESGNIQYAHSGNTYELDTSLFTDPQVKYMITVDLHSEEAKNGWYERFLGTNPAEGWFICDTIELPYHKDSVKNAYVFGTAS